MNKVANCDQSICNLSGVRSERMGECSKHTIKGDTMKTTIVYMLMSYGSNHPFRVPYRVLVGVAEDLVKRYPREYSVD